uniref:Zinc transporter 2 n=1 Tax=Anthurium amnicola TaxID=1678845 RepID=A0A1D1XI71_9ARAE
MARPTLSSCILPILLLLLLLSISVSGHGNDDDADAGGDGDAPPPDLRARSLVLVKIWCLILVFVGTFAGGVSPYFFKWNEAFLALGIQFAGGVFFGTALMHFLSDAAETFEDLTKKEYPFAFMLASAGYLLTMLADCVISGVVGRHKGRHGGEVGGGGGGDAGNRGSSQKSSSNGGYSQTDIEAEEQKFGHVNHSIANVSSLGDSILLIVALCFHSVFEGIAIGVAENKADAWRALWTVSLHKVFAAVAMGIALLRMIPNRPFLSCVAYAFAFAISSPIGVAIGIVIDATTQGRVADWIYAISMGIACGVFIYVSINHLLAKGYKSQRAISADTPFNRWLAVMLGIGVIAVVMIWD